MKRGFFGAKRCIKVEIDVLNGHLTTPEAA